jgi:hypothetical protein
LIVSPPSIYRDSTRYCCCVFSSLFRLSLFYYYYIERNMKFRHNWIIPPLNLRFSVAVSFFLLTLNRRLIERRSQTIETTFKYTNRVTFIFFLFVVFTHTNNNNNSSFSMISAFGCLNCHVLSLFHNCHLSRSIIKNSQDVGRSLEDFLSAHPFRMRWTQWRLRKRGTLWAVCHHQ